MMRLDTRDLRDFWTIYYSLDQSYLGKSGQYHRRRWCRCRTFVPRYLLAMRVEMEADLALDHAVDQQTDDCEHR